MRDYGTGPNDSADDSPAEYCALCGDPLPLDGVCACIETDLDPTVARNRLKRNLVFTHRGRSTTYDAQKIKEKEKLW